MTGASPWAWDHDAPSAFVGVTVLSCPDQFVEFEAVTGQGRQPQPGTADGGVRPAQGVALFSRRPMAQHARCAVSSAP
jgi:hypothetical protein